MTGLLSTSSLIFVEGTLVVLLSTLYLTAFHNGLIPTLRRLSATDLRNAALQGIVGAGTLVCLTVAFKHLPSGVALSIFYTNPIIAVFVARVVLRERVTYITIIALFLAVSGAVLVTHDPSSSSSSSDMDEGNTSIGLMLAFCAALFGSFIPVRTRILMTEYSLRHNDDELSFMVPALSVGLVVIMLGVLLGGYTGPYEVLVADGLKGAVWKCMPGVLVAAAQAMVGIGFRVCDAGTGSIMMTMELPMAYSIQTAVLGEQSSVGCTLGAVLLLMSAITVAVSKIVVEM